MPFAIIGRGAKNVVCGSSHGLHLLVAEKPGDVIVLEKRLWLELIDESKKRVSLICAIRPWEQHYIPVERASAYRSANDL